MASPRARHALDVVRPPAAVVVDGVAMAVLVVARVVVLVVVVAVVVVLLLVVLALVVAAVRAARRVKGVAALDGRALVAQLRFLVLVCALGLLEDGQQLLALENVSETSAMISRLPALLVHLAEGSTTAVISKGAACRTAFAGRLVEYGKSLRMQ